MQLLQIHKISKVHFGWVIMLCGGAWSWRVGTTPIQGHSSCEVEYIGIDDAVLTESQDALLPAARGLVAGGASSLANVQASAARGP